MPIRPEHRWLYPIDWPQLSATIRFGRARGQCEGCGRPHGLEVRQLEDGRWTRVVLATAHLDHDPTNNRPANLKALCQRCHITHDRQEHSRRRWLTHRMRKAMGDLFVGPYRV